MIAATHLAFATTLYLGGSARFEYPADPVTWGITLLFALLPDIDLPTSRIGRPLFWLSVRLERQHGHRTLTHSLVALVFVAGLAAPCWWLQRPGWFWAMVGGYWSHLWLDMLNLRGIDLFWPAAVRVVLPGRPTYRMEVGSKAEMVLLTALVALAVGLFPVSQMGLRAGLHQWLRNFDMAVDEYREAAGTHWYSLDLAAIDNLTLEHVKCQCMAGRSLGWLMDTLNGLPELYLLGELWIDAAQAPPVEDLELYHPVTASGERVRLHYARPADLAHYRRLVAIRGEFMVQGWGESGAALAGLPLDAKAVRGEMPKGLRGLF